MNFSGIPPEMRKILDDYSALKSLKWEIFEVRPIFIIHV